MYNNMLGAKVGEAGTVASTTAYVNAVYDALSEYDFKELDMPITPMKVWKIINNN